MVKRMDAKRSKIIATLGPASSSHSIVSALIRAGVDVFRINASHIVDPSDIYDRVALIREVASELNRIVAVFLDLQGPKIRIGDVANGRINVANGQEIIFTTEKVQGTESMVSVSYPGFVSDVKVGDPLYIDDGKIRLRVLRKEEKTVVCKVLKGGELSSRKGVNLPKTDIRESPITEKDKADAVVAVKAGVDYIALSFVSSADDIHELRRYMSQVGDTSCQIIAKIERQLAVDRMDSIIEAADAVMVARGDLGVEIGVEHVPRVQKKLIWAARRLVKPVIVATQMLETMIHSTTATRAEVSDVANAIYDGCDAVMLSGETAIGVSPVAAVKTMSIICSATDDDMMLIKRERYSGLPKFVSPTVATSFCKAADQIGEENNATAIMAFTSSGNTPLIASRLNSSFPIISPTDDESVARRSMLYRGVIPMMMPVKFKDIHRWTEMINVAVDEAKNQALLDAGDTVVVTAGRPIGKSNGINSIRLIAVS